MSSNGSVSKGSRQSKRPTPLRMVKEEVRQYRQPIIIHTYSPKIIHVDVAQFSTLVQSLTGRGQKRKPEESPKVRESVPEEFSCASPSSSADSGFPGGVPEGSYGLASPRGPLATFDHFYQQGFEVSSSPPSLQEASDHASNMFTNAVLAAAAASAGPQSSPFFSNPFPTSLPRAFSPLPSPDFYSPSFMADLPIFSPSMLQQYQQNQQNQPYDYFTQSPGYGRFSNAGLFPSPGSSNAFTDMALMMATE